METLLRGGKTYLLLSGYRTTIKLLPRDLFHHVIRPEENFQRETLFDGTLAAMAEYATICAWNKCYIFGNILQTHTWSWTWLYLQKANENMFPTLYCPYGNNRNFSHMRQIHFSSKIGLWNKCTNGGEQPQNLPLPIPNESCTLTIHVQCTYQ